MIRYASYFDQEQIIDLLELYKQHSPLELHKDTCDREYIKKLLAQIFAGRGAIFVNDDHGKLNGMIIALKNPNIWDNTIICVNELAYWVNPDVRGGTIGYRLLKQYQDYCEELKAQGEIQYYTVSKMITSPDLNYSKFGFKKLEEMWSQ
jgi:GNAT superfamily N-acetyltransferase